MNKKRLAAAVSAALAAPAAMAGDITLYGQIHIATSSYNADIDTGDAWDISGHASRLGFKGSEQLRGDLQAVWQIELGIAASDSDNDTTSESGVSYRNTFVGLSGNWGTALIGRHDTPMKISTGSLDLFADTIADYNNNGADDAPLDAGDYMGAGLPFFTWQGIGFVDLRVDQAIAYVSPNFNGLTLAAAIVQPGMDFETTLGITANDGDSFAEAYSVAAMYSNGPFFASLAWERVSEDFLEEFTGAWPTIQAIMEDDSRWRMGLGYSANGLHVGLVYERQDVLLKGADAERWQISGAYSFGNNVVKAMYGENEFRDLPTFWVPGSPTFDVDVKQWAIGLDHNFSRRTKAYVVYTDAESEFTGPWFGPDSLDWDGFSVGLVHKF
jgi:predicted porin